MAALELDGLTKTYGEVVAAQDLTFDVEAGEVFGYLGPNGAGKTTTIRTLLGFISPTAGSARVLGADVRNGRELIEARRRIGYLSDDPGFDDRSTGTRILDLHESVKGGERREELLELFDPPVDRPVREYSRGNVQKLGLVTTFMHDPELVILDEPTSGLDPLMKQRFSEFLRRERERGLTVFFSSHILSEVRRLCDRVAIIRDGSIVTIDPLETLLVRSGKAVRINSAEPIPLETLDIDGVHDLETASPRSPTESPTETDDEPLTEADDEPLTDDGATFTECTFTFTGDVNALLAELPEGGLVDLSIEEAPLEDVFMRFYGGEEDV